MFLLVSFLIYFFFFFQAEDGIRDPLVTGVQTCALPISLDELSATLHRGCDLTHPADLESSMEGRRKLIQGDGAPYEREVRLRRKDGSRSEERRVGKEGRARREGCR